MDLGVTNRAGSRLGPRAVRAVERIGPYEHNLKIAPLAGCAVADVGDVTMQSRYDLAGCHRDIEAYFDRVRAAGVLPLAVGGDHSISLPILQADRQSVVEGTSVSVRVDLGGSRNIQKNKNNILMT